MAGIGVVRIVFSQFHHNITAQQEDVSLTGRGVEREGFPDDPRPLIGRVVHHKGGRVDEEVAGTGSDDGGFLSGVVTVNSYHLVTWDCQGCDNLNTKYGTVF